MKLKLGRLLGLVLTSLVLAIPAFVVAIPAFAVQAQDGREEAAAPDTGADEDVEDTEVDADVREEGGQKVKVFRFSGLDISGRLKSPQLLYFLNRLRAEFDRPKLPHRSFVPELVRSTKAPGM